MLHTYGPSPALFVEDTPDASNPAAVPLRTAGASIPIRDGSTGVDLAPATTAPGGYLYYEIDDVPHIQIKSAQWDGTKWVEAWVDEYSNETKVGWSTSAATAQQALATATSADTKAQQALDWAGSNGAITIAGVTGTTFTLKQIGARSINDPISTNEINGLSPVATTGTWEVLQDKPAWGVGNGFATLINGKVPVSQLPASSGGGGGLVLITQNADGSWPARNTATSDPTQQVWYNPAYDPSKRPTIGADTSTAYAADPAASIPGDVLLNKGAQ